MSAPRLKLPAMLEDWLPVLVGVAVIGMAALAISLTSEPQQVAQAAPELSQVGSDATVWQGPPERPSH